MEAPGKPKLIHRLRNRYRLSLIHDETFQERFSLRLTPLNVILVVLGLFMVSGGIVYSLVAFTPLRQHVIPGYLSDSYREDAVYSRAQVDSLKDVTARQDRYIQDLRIVLGGGVITPASQDTTNQSAQPGDLEFEMIEEDSLLRERVGQEPSLGLDFETGGEDATLANLLLFKPLEGTLTGRFDTRVQHFGVDVVAPENSVVKAVKEGTVFFAGFTIDGGHEIHVQHANNVVSVYKHNSKLFKQTGDRVETGESVAVVGNTGGYTDGPHLHFELWIEGVPVDPEDYLAWD